MRITVKHGAWVALVGAGVAGLCQAHADVAAGADGLQIRSADDNLSATLGGRVQFDGYLDRNDGGSGIGSGAPGEDANSGFRFRRVWLTVTGRVYGFDYHVDYDLVSSTLNRAWLSHRLLAGGTLYIGQNKPWASLDELASNADTPFLERNITSASGVNSVATYTNGLYYAWHDHAFVDDDNLWLGISASSLHKQGKSTDTSTQGTAFNARIAYAPIVEKQRWLHFGASFINANAASGSTTSGTDELLASYVYGNHFDGNEKLTLASYAVSGNRGRPHTNTFGAELAGAYGPAYLQAEYDRVAFHQDGEPDDAVTAYSVTAAYAVTGETRPYVASDASYGGIEPLHSYGAFELAVRYDRARNAGSNGTFTGLELTGAKASLATLDEVSLITVGLNYYANAHCRLVLDYQHGKADLGRAGTDSPSTIGIRAQVVF
jgi:phosphate-selective porin OprO and OprP